MWLDFSNIGSPSDNLKLKCSYLVFTILDDRITVYFPMLDMIIIIILTLILTLSYPYDAYLKSTLTLTLTLSFLILTMTLSLTLILSDCWTFHEFGVENGKIIRWGIKEPFNYRVNPTRKSQFQSLKLDQKLVLKATFLFRNLVPHTQIMISSRQFCKPWCSVLQAAHLDIPKWKVENPHPRTLTLTARHNE